MNTNKLFCHACLSDRIELQTLSTIIGPIAYIQCQECRSLFRETLDPEPVTLYSGSYYSFKEPSETSSRASLLLDRLFLLVRSKLIYSLLRGGSPLPPLFRLNILDDKSRHFLDVGCGSGNLIRKLRSLGYVNSIGIDPYLKRDSDLALRKSVLDMKNVGLYDIVMYNHSLEHAPDWDKQIQFLGARMKDGSRLVLRLPIISPFSEYAKGSWGQLDPAHHLNLFSATGLCRFLEKSGFAVERILYDSYYFMFTETIMSVAVVHKFPPVLSSLIGFFVRNRCSFLLFNILALPFNLLRSSDQISILCRK